MTLLSDPKTCPHGHPIPPKDLSDPKRIGMPLAQVEAGRQTAVVGVTEEVPEILRYLGQVGLRPGAKVQRYREGAARRSDDGRKWERTPRDFARARANGYGGRAGMKVTGALIALNLIGYAWEILIGGPGMLSPTGGGNIDRVMQDGSLYPAAVLQNGEWWRIFTGAFLHGGLIHIARQHDLAVVARALRRNGRRAVRRCSSSTWFRSSPPGSASSISARRSSPPSARAARFSVSSARSSRSG